MRTIDAQEITHTIARLCMEANYNLGADMLAAFDNALTRECSPAGCDVLALLSKQALFRTVGEPNPEPALAVLEEELLDQANALGIGPQGYGGDTTAFAIHINTYPCHIASLPVAVTIECHAHRHQEAVL